MKIILKIFIVLLLLGALALVSVGGFFAYFWSSNLPFIGSLAYYQPPQITEVYGDDGTLIGEFYRERRKVVPFAEIPAHVIQAFLAAEDANFFKHPGLDWKGILRAMVKNLMAGRVEQGGSTITQQVTKSLLLKEQERTFRRKVREALLSLQLEKRFTKNEILYFYLNQIYFGEGAYGIEMAARTYFGKSTRELTLGEAAILAGLPKAPSRYSPKRNLELAKARQGYVLKRMLEEGMIGEKEYEEALKEPIHVHRVYQAPQIGPYFLEHVRKLLTNKYGEEVVYRGGLKVYTTLDPKMQSFAEAALQKGLKEVDRREGYRGPLDTLPKDKWPEFLARSMEIFKENPPAIGDVVQALVVKVEKDQVWVRIGEKEGVLRLQGEDWVRKTYVHPETGERKRKLGAPLINMGDIIEVRIISPGLPGRPWQVAIDQTPLVQGALFCMEPKTGYVRAMVGGYDFKQSQFNRATQARRQPGSSFKPIVYTAAIDSGMTPSTVVLDAPIVLSTGGQIWAPKNYRDTYIGPTTLRNALAKSLNVVTVRVLKSIGVKKAVEYAKKMGIHSPLEPNLALALGASGVYVYEMVTAFCTLANLGKLVEPIYIKAVLDNEGDILEQNVPNPQEVLSPDTAYVMVDMMKAVITEGTGWKVKALGRPAAGKTGTSNDLRDAWFVGFVPDLAAGVWVGYDDYRPMGQGETGGIAAAPIWLYFMAEALKDKPIKDFEVPEGVVFVKMDESTGEVKEAGEGTVSAFKTKEGKPVVGGHIQDGLHEEFLLRDME